MTAHSRTKWAVLLGATAGGLAAVWSWERPPASAQPSSNSYAAAAPAAPATHAAAVPSPTAETLTTRAPTADPESAAATESAGASAPDQPPNAAVPELLRSPHDQPLRSEGELRAAEVRCIESKDGDACMRAADAFAAGAVVVADQKEAKRYASIARTHYVAQCEGQSSLACQRLSLLYRSGDGVRQSTWTADELLARARDHCHLRRNREFCAALGVAGAAADR